MPAKCISCGLHRYRRKIVVGRGSLPADVLFIGEAPGKSEDLRGIPFIGPSGRLLNNAIEAAAFISKNGIPKYYITNAVQCRPTDSCLGPNRQPTEEEAVACRPRLVKIISKARPLQVVFLGKVPERLCKSLCPGGIRLHHPAYILRLGGEKTSEYRMLVRELATIFDTIKEEKQWRGNKKV